MRMTARLPRSFGRRGAIAGILLAASVMIAVTGCSPTGTASERVIPKKELLAPILQTYPRIPVVENVQYGTANGKPLLLDVCLPGGHGTRASGLTPRPAIVSVHGGSWAHGDKANINWRSVCQWLASEGYVAVSVGYELTPSVVFPAAIDNIKTAVRWLRASAQVKRYSIDPKLIGAFGGSAGGNLVALLGTEGTGPLDRGSRVAAVAELSGPADLTLKGDEQKFFYNVQLAYLGCKTYSDCPDARAASPLYQVNDTDPPFFIGHSTHERIPLSQSQALVAKLRAAGVDTTFVTVAGTRHSIAMLDKSMRDRIGAWFHSKLVPAGSRPQPAPTTTAVPSDG